MSQIKWVIVAELLLDSGTEYVSAERVRRTTSPGQIIYSGTVARWGTIEKSIPNPTGMPQISNAKIQIRDDFRKWRDLLSFQTPRRRIMRITVLPEGGSVAAYDPVYTGEVVDVVFNPAAIEIELRDITFAWLDEPIPACAIQAIFPDISATDDGGFIPIPFGNCLSPEVSPAIAQGVVPLPHIGLIETVEGSPLSSVDRWAVSLTPILGVVIYRRQTASVNEDVSTPEYVVVDSSEYQLSQQTIAAEDNPFGFGAFTMTHVDFFEEQPQGTQIRADIYGIYTRGEWGPLAAFDGSLVSPQVTDRNPISVFINTSYLIMMKAGLSVNVFDTDQIAALWQTFEDLGLYCDGAITKPMTAREWLGQFLTSFNLDLYVNRRGLISLQFSQDPDDISPALNPPTFKEGVKILRDSFSERLPEQISTQLQYRWNYNNATDRFQSSGIINTDDQSVLNVPDESSPTSTIEKIEKNVVDFHYVRDSNTAQDIITRRTQHLALGSYRQTFTMPLPATFDDVELAQLCKLTHTMGIPVGGYVGQTAKILKVTYDLDQLETRLETQVYPPIRLSRRVRFRSYIEYEDDPPVNPARSHISNGENGIDSDADDSQTYASLFCVSPLSGTQPAMLHYFNAPEPPGIPTAVRVVVYASYVAGTGVLTFIGQPESRALIFSSYTNNYLATPIASVLDTNFSADQARTRYEYTFTGAQFQSLFGGLAANIYLRFDCYMLLLEVFSPPAELRPWDAFLEFEY